MQVCGWPCVGHADHSDPGHFGRGSLKESELGKENNNGKEEQNKSLNYSLVLSLSCPSLGHLGDLVLKVGNHRRSRWASSGASVALSPLSMPHSLFFLPCADLPPASH